MRRITQIKNNKNVILLEECKDNWSIASNEAQTRYWISGTAVDRLAAYEDTGLTPEEMEALKAFKAYFDDMYGKGLEVANWHMNGNLEPFDNFYENANNAGKIHCRNCDYLNMDSGKPYCCHPHMSTSGLDDWCDHAKRKESNNA